MGLKTGNLAQNTMNIYGKFAGFSEWCFGLLGLITWLMKHDSTPPTNCAGLVEDLRSGIKFHQVNPVLRQNVIC